MEQKMFAKVKRMAAAGTLALTMMLGVIVQGATGEQPNPGAANAGVIIRDGTSNPPTVVAGIIVRDVTVDPGPGGVGGLVPPGPYAA